MILSIHIKNIALIKELDLELSAGLNILSGETGAGKSIIIDSLNFVLGDRADRSLIRHGEQSASVQVVFSNENDPQVLQILSDYGIENDDIIIICRTMTDNGKGDCRANGTLINLVTLKKLVTRLVDIHSQQEHQALLNEANHIVILDNYCKDLPPVKVAFLQHFNTYKQSLAEKNEFSDSDQRNRQIDIYTYQLAEIDRVGFKDGEEDELVALRTKYNNAERLINSIASAVTLLDNEETYGAISAIHTASKELTSILKFDEHLGELVERLDSAKIELNDILDTLNTELENLNFDPNEMEALEKRLQDIRAIKKRFGASASDIDKYYTKISAELTRLKNATERIDTLDEIIAEEGKKAVFYAKEMHKIRASNAVGFSEAIIANLKELGMQSSTFEVEDIFGADDDHILADCSSIGADSIRFLISPNKGEPLKPLAKIASGGEMSRFMLGLKNITAELEGIDTLVFDEIDTGISGKIAKVVASKLYQIATTRQVIAVTHLPQLASMADTHYLINKEEVGEKTMTFVKKLDDVASLQEIMRLAGSAEGSKIGYENALELKKWANDYKATCK